ncbi:hypothetical protein BDR04DRAFT_1123063 [Suillus decipiens]|nr:hypothetical protein BDR04DRAFT_1123063 [Suillus decipiens]
MAAVQQTFPGSELDVLFPSPTSPPTVLCPSQYPGASPKAVAALTYVLKDKYTKYHIFLNSKGFHNHITHRMLALYAMGATRRNPSVPAVEPPEVIAEENFIEHLGDENFYAAYKTFFTKVFKERRLSSTLEEYIFSKKHNFIEGQDTSAQLVMLAHFLGVLFHGFIHVGYGAEMGISGMIVEGLSMTSVHEREFLPSYLFESSGTTAVEEATTRLASLLLNTKMSIAPSQLERSPKYHAFSILAKIMQNPKFAPKEINNLMSEHGDYIWQYAEQWTIDLSQPGKIERKMEECIWTSTILYSIGGWNKDRSITADFYLQHASGHIKSLPSIYVALPDAKIAKAKVNNEFLDIVQSAITHPNDHMSKIQRAFAHFSSIYGTRLKGYFKDTGLKGTEALDGSLFLRAARLTEEYMNEGTRSFSLEAFPARD